MKIDIFANMMGVNWSECGCANALREKMEVYKQPEYYVYREGYTITKSGKIKEPSIYSFDYRFIKIKGSGHEKFCAMSWDKEYEIFLTRESALEYATRVQKRFFEQKEKDDVKKTQDELKLLRELAEKYNYTLIENQKGEK